MIVRATFSARKAIRRILLIAGISCLGIWSGSILYSQFRQIYDGWRFDRESEAAAPVTADQARPATTRKNGHAAPAIVPDDLIGRVKVPRLNLSAMVEEGTDDSTLGRAVGHVTGTALPGAAGNVAIAGHRDSFFRALKDLQRNDEIDFETAAGSFRYTVVEMSVVEPSDTAVLAPTRDKTLTIVTCFPFHYIGPAPRRFIVRARQVAEVSRWSAQARKSGASRVESFHPE